jgi:type II secretory pathway pseudopilin PulG
MKRSKRSKVKGQKFYSAGQSIIEVMVAVAILTIIAATGVVAILGSLNTTRLAEEETQATTYAMEGVEAVQSIRNQDWDNITAGTYGLAKSGNVWSFSGSSDDPDGTAKFTRVVTVADVSRDSNGAIVTSGGTDDEETKQLTVVVSWNFNAARANSVDMVSLVTNWQKSRTTPGAGAPEVSTCSAYCPLVGFSSGTCRANPNQCSNNGESYKPPGDQYCTGGASVDTCCCGS